MIGDCHDNRLAQSFGFPAAATAPRNTKTLSPPTRRRADSPWPTGPPKAPSPPFGHNSSSTISCKTPRAISTTGKRVFPLCKSNGTQASERPSLSWNVEAKLEQGAFATFLGVTMVRSPDGIPHWAAMAVGDTCLFHTRGSTLLRAFPLEQSNKFNNSPPLLGSRMSPEAIQKTPALHLHGDGLADDRLWMMTDALVQWCLMEHEGGRDPWGEIDSILATTGTPATFRRLD